VLEEKADRLLANKVIDETSASLDHLIQGVQANCHLDWIIISYPDYHLLLKTSLIRRDLKVLKLELAPTLVKQISHEGFRLKLSPARFAHGRGSCFSIVSTVGYFSIRWNIRKILEGKNDPYTVTRYADEKALEEAINCMVTCNSTGSK
jgi:hypothetical protein